jgi:hypothetical protein
MFNVFAQNITVDVLVLDNKLDDSVFKGFHFSIFHELLEVSNAMVANESGI